MSSKRVEQLTGTFALRPAARAILRSRLRSTTRLLKDVSSGCVKKAEYVHQLRVSIRRAEAAISAFEPCLNPKAVAKIRKRLKTVRKAAGTARDCDVHASLSKPLAESEAPEEQLLAEYLSRRLKSDRRRAGKALISVARRCDVRKLKRARRKVLKLASGEGSTLHDAAVQTLGQVCRASRAAGAADLQSLTNLHALRVSAKQVRYAVEVFRACLSTELCESTLAQLRELQAVLGRVNDARQMSAWLAEESRRLAATPDPRGIPRGATPELIYEELRVVLGRFETELEAAHAAAVPLVAGKLETSLHPLEEWLATQATGRAESEPATERTPAGRSAEGTPVRHEQHRRAASVKS